EPIRSIGRSNPPIGPLHRRPRTAAEQHMTEQPTLLRQVRIEGPRLVTLDENGNAQVGPSMWTLLAGAPGFLSKTVPINAGSSTEDNIHPLRTVPMDSVRSDVHSLWPPAPKISVFASGDADPSGKLDPSPQPMHVPRLLGVHVTAGWSNSAYAWD